MKTFPAIVTGIFIVLAIGSAVIFARYSSSGQSGIGTVVVWGAVPKAAFDALVNDLGAGNSNYTGVSYQQVSSAQLIPLLVQSIASGKSPDLVMLPEEYLVGNTAKIQPISYSVSGLSRREFQNTFIQAGENFLGANGVYGIPFTVDPMVMYWNRSFFAEAGIANPPAYWDELADMAPKLTKANKNGTLTRSAVAFGGWDNVTHAKEILLSLMYQLGNPVVTSSGGAYQSVLSSANGGATLPADSALSFYTDFANPGKANYSWNSSEPYSRDAFVGGELAIYFGQASELASIRAANPNLNFDVAPMPAIRGGNSGAYAKVTALSIPRGAANPSGALAVAQAFTTQASQVTLSNVLGTPSVRRDVSPGNAADPYMVIFRNASLTGFSFLDPDPSASDSILKRMVENVTSGRSQVSAATASANQDLSALLQSQ